MNTARIIVRLDAEHGAADLEIMVPHGDLDFGGLDHLLMQLGIDAVGTVESSTPRYRVISTTVMELDRAKLNTTRTMQVLRAVRNWVNHRPSRSCSRAA